MIKKTTELEKEETEFAFVQLKGFREFAETLLVEGTPVEIATSHPVVRIYSFYFSFFSYPSQYHVFLLLTVVCWIGYGEK